MSWTLALIIGLIVALVATVIIYLFVMPERGRDKLPGFLGFLHDFFNFKTLMVEKIIRVLNVFCSVGCIAVGIFLLFGSNFVWGILLIIFGPLVVRVIYELMMLKILQVQNVISINRKLK